jgi:AraC-like DNA-binding protein
MGAVTTNGPEPDDSAALHQTGKSGFRRTERRIEEPHEFRDAVTGIDLTVLFQKHSGQPGFVEQFQSPRWALDYGSVHAPTRVRGIVQGGWASFCLSLGPGDALWNGQKAPPGCLALLPPGCEVDGGTLVDFNWITAAIPPWCWEECLRLAGIDETGPNRLTVVSLPEPVFAHLRDRLASTRRLLAGTQVPCLPRLQEETPALVLDAFAIACAISARRPSRPTSLWNRSRLVRAAEEWMLAHLGDPIRVPDLCAALRVSRREIEYAFRSIFDKSPRDYLETLRLHAIRRALLDAASDGTRVIDIAYAHGMPHLGRFAASYRALFGENPVETLKRP